MVLFSLLLSAGLGQVSPQPKPETPQKTTQTPEARIVLQDRVIPLPALPKDVGEAKAHYPAIHTQLQGALHDLEMPILPLRAAIPAGKELPKTMKLRPAEAKDARVLVQILNDPTYDALEKGVVEVWQRWVGVLVENGIAKPNQSISKNMNQPGVATNASLKTKLDRIESTWERDDDDRLMRRYSGERDLNEGSDARAPSLFPAELKAYDKGVEAVAKRAAVAKELAPQLSEAWTPLVAHLNACAVKLADLDHDTATPTPDFEMLHRRTQIVFFERFRSALWFCEVVWSQMASVDPPPPLRDLK